jgi:Holliday junction resolvase RusA-like endonuclease
MILVISDTATWQKAAVIVVHGTPAGQGQVSFNGKGRGARHTNEKTLKPWRRAIISATRETTGCHGYTEWKPTPKNSVCLTCRVPKDQHGLYANIPTGAEITITIEKPKSAPKHKQTWPITRYSTDIDHHARACLDSLSESGVIKDDSQVIELTARKVYPGEHPDALDQPGAIIRLYTLGDPT